ncbi:MAG: PIN domain-containing protein [Bacteroidota bacterium]
MKECIIDANILFSALISGKSFYETLFVKHTFYTPDFALREIHNYRELIVDKMKGDEEHFRQFAKFLFSNLVIMPEFIICNIVSGISY